MHCHKEIHLTRGRHHRRTGGDNAWQAAEAAEREINKGVGVNTAGGFCSPRVHPVVAVVYCGGFAV